MRLDRELGTLNREIIAIKEKWKIALNIDSKKVAIERLITRRKRLRDSGVMSQMVEDAIKEEEKFISLQASSLETKDAVIEQTVATKEKDLIPTKRIVSESIEITESKLVKESEDSEKPAHLTVSWLKNRMRDR